MDGSPMCKNKTDSKTIKSKKKCLHVTMIHQVTQLQMQSIEELNNCNRVNLIIVAQQQ